MQEDAASSLKTVTKCWVIVQVTKSKACFKVVVKYTWFNNNNNNSQKGQKYIYFTVNYIFEMRI